MKKYSGWSGTDSEILRLVKYCLSDFGGSFPDLTEREVKSLFCAAFASNIVQAELFGSMCFQFDNGEDGSSERQKLDALVSKYR